ncbi:Protein GPR107 [Cryptotermes secundus]|uniref:Protein GPR107 n=1 Tax=Cryptotermes secundus TaxID=105785 RepID=A0A2J7RSE4_9NEOP|nr:protein GPR107 [Cryptotermes secundus]PNF43747.1 Protein GPR107 [Cryptotermes secundus]PNF43748.1 Protein GPR107 [Cryptotermes secundus]
MEAKHKCEYIVLFMILQHCCARIHKLDIKNDVRKYIALSTFGFYKGGLLEVKLRNFRPTPYHELDVFGFSLDRTRNDAVNPYLEDHQDVCLLQDWTHPKPNSETIYFRLNLKKKLLQINCSHDFQSIQISKDTEEMAEVRSKRGYAASRFSDAFLVHQHRKKRHAEGIGVRGNLSVTRPVHAGKGCPKLEKLEFPITERISDGVKYFNTNFVVSVESEIDEGLYSLYFHNCPNYKDGSPVVHNFMLEIEENNSGNYLSAGEMPLPALYFMMSLLFFLSGCFWLFILRKSKHPVFKIHYFMAVLVYLKSLSLMFHGINYHFIQTKGEHIAAWAILYYVAHLLKGAVLFITIVLVGTGWTFIKHILSEKDKKIFMIVIPLQVLANVADIIIEESEEGAVEHRTWRNVFTLVDFLCCGAILFPIVWSIRHLQEASHTDGKAAINLRKLKLFRHFYIMIICYIYSTRIIVYLLKITVPFQYEWLDEMFHEMATYVFFVLTGYKFRPASANPYFQLSTDEDAEETDIVVTQSGLTEGLSKIARTTKVIVDEISDEEKDNFLAKRESSHEYD